VAQLFKSVRENWKFNEAPEQLAPSRSREAAKDCSLRRKPWGDGTSKSPEGAKEANLIDNGGARAARAQPQSGGIP
jgi:hypothetical protein